MYIVIYWCTNQLKLLTNPIASLSDTYIYMWKTSRSLLKILQKVFGHNEMFQTWVENVWHVDNHSLYADNVLEYGENLKNTMLSHHTLYKIPHHTIPLLTIIPHRSTRVTIVSHHRTLVIIIPYHATLVTIALHHATLVIIVPHHATLVIIVPHWSPV